MYFKKFLYHRKCIHFKEFNLCKQQTVSEGELPVFLYITGQKGKNKSLLPGQQKAKFKKGENIMNVPKKFISDTYETSSIIFTTNKEIMDWAEMMGDPVLTTALLDRILHHANCYSFRGESYRLKHPDMFT